MDLIFLKNEAFQTLKVWFISLGSQYSGWVLLIHFCSAVLMGYILTVKTLACQRWCISKYNQYVFSSPECTSWCVIVITYCDILSVINTKWFKQLILQNHKADFDESLPRHFCYYQCKHRSHDHPFLLNYDLLKNIFEWLELD